MRNPRLGIILLLLLSREANAAISALASRGYAVLPEPRRVELAASDFNFGPAWSLQKTGVPTNDIAGASLTEGLQARFHLAGPGSGAGAIPVVLSIAPGSVSIGDSLDSDKAAIAAQAYRLELSSRRITVTANASPGLFYGVQTLLQLIAPRDDGSLRLPEGQIADWPDRGSGSSTGMTPTTSIGPRRCAPRSRKLRSTRSTDSCSSSRATFSTRAPPRWSSLTRCRQRNCNH
jgi:hypothetical protein